MATSVREIAEVFDDVGMSYDIASENQVVTGFDSLSNYRNPQGVRALTLVVELSEGGRYFTLFAPMAYNVPDHRAALFLQACAMVQWRTKLIQFEYDANDGEVRPVVEFPLEDAPLTKAQLLRCITGLVQLVDEYHPVLERVIEEGVVDFDDAEAMSLLNRLAAAMEGGVPSGHTADHTGRATAPAARASGGRSERALGDIRFVSTDHVRYQGGRDVSGPNPGCRRGVRVEPNVRGGEGYTVTIHNLDGPHPVWGNNVQMAPKQMRVVRETPTEVELRGFGADPMGAPFSDYGLTLHFDGDDVEKAALHLRDRGVDIVYLK